VHPLAWRSTLQSRLMTVAAIFAVWTIGIEARLFYLQVVQHSDLKARADRQQLDTIDVPAKRGEIVDRHGRVLAYSVDADTVFANPHQVRDPVRTAALVCGAIDDCGSAMRESMEKALRRRNTHFVYLARKLPPKQAALIRDMNLEGVAFLKENRRYYPKGEIGAHLIGYVGTDNVGLAGLESAYDPHVRGKDGKVLVTTDARQHAVFSRVDRAATTGAGLELTIDQMLQYIAERELKAAVLETRAAGGSVVVMQPSTGEILALANYPTFDPNAFQKSDTAERRNRAIQDLYEPGSTFKLVTASAALEEDVIDADDPVDCAPGFIKFEGRPAIRDVHTYGVLPFSDVIVKSSNVGAIKVGLKLGPERLSRYVSRFGFGQPIAPDFRGESPGIVWHPSRLDSSALASVSMGYQVAVTPVQMAAATSSIANGGTLVEPRIVRALIKDGRRTSVQPRAIRRTVSARTAAELTAIMEEVVERGTARRAQIAGFTVAGKTGTAAKLVDGRYSKSEYNASFVGFVPSRNPALTIIVVIDTPRSGGGNYYMGGVAAAPVFQRIAEASLRHLGVAPNINAPAPVLVARNDPEVPLTPTGGVVSERTVIERTEPGTMPDLRGLGAREAIRLLATLGMTARMSGNGFVVEHRPAAGTPLVRGDRAILKLGRRMPAVPARSDR
jgi:cell division protein FtsI (penicillin-binding protein 3)